MQEFERCPFGIIGLETAIGLSLEQLYHSGMMTLSQARPAVHDGAGAIVLPRPRNAARGRARRT